MPTKNQKKKIRQTTTYVERRKQTLEKIEEEKKFGTNGKVYELYGIIGPKKN
jgi:hypothetical protein